MKKFVALSVVALFGFSLVGCSPEPAAPPAAPATAPTTSHEEGMPAAAHTPEGGGSTEAPVAETPDAVTPAAPAAEGDSSAAGGDSSAAESK